MYSDRESGRYFFREFRAIRAAMAVKVMLLWWCREEGMEPYTGDRFNWETGEAMPAISSKAAARPTFLRMVDVGSCLDCFSTSFAALGFLTVFCLIDMLADSVFCPTLSGSVLAI